MRARKVSKESILRVIRDDSFERKTVVEAKAKWVGWCDSRGGEAEAKISLGRRNS